MKKTTKSGKVFNDEELRRALFAFQDLMERLGGCVFYPLRKTAEQVYNEAKMEDDAIYVGIKEAEFTESRKSMFFTLLEGWHIKPVETKSGWEFSLEGIPIKLAIIKRDYKYFRNPEIRFFGVTEFMLPNPLKEYLKAQYLIH